MNLNTKSQLLILCSIILSFTLTACGNKKPSGPDQTKLVVNQPLVIPPVGYQLPVEIRNNTTTEATYASQSQVDRAVNSLLAQKQ